MFIPILPCIPLVHFTSDLSEKERIIKIEETYIQRDLVFSEGDKFGLEWDYIVKCEAKIEDEINDGVVINPRTLFLFSDTVMEWFSAM
jgi:hypothetical protein